MNTSEQIPEARKLENRVLDYQRPPEPPLPLLPLQPAPEPRLLVRFIVVLFLGVCVCAFIARALLAEGFLAQALIWGGGAALAFTDLWARRREAKRS